MCRHMDKVGCVCATLFTFFLCCAGVQSASVTQMTTTAVNNGSDNAPDDVSDDDQQLSTEFWVWMMAVASGGVALVFGIVYTYIYCTKIRHMPRSHSQSSTGSQGRRYGGGGGGSAGPSGKSDKDKLGQVTTTRKNPFYFVGKMIYLAPGHHSKQNPLTPSRRY